MTVSNKTKKFISGLLIILILLPSVLLSFPKTGYAVWGAGDVGTNPIGDFSTSSIAASSLELLATSLKDLALKYQDQAQKILQELAKAVAKKVLAEMTKSTINWINSDFHGSPLFLTNPQSFFGDIAKSQLKNIVNTYGYNNLLYPFGKQFALDAINLYKTTQENNATYTLSNVMNSAQLNSYRNDFSYGGWNGFLTNTQYPQNNVLGFQMIATQQLAITLPVPFTFY